MRIVEDDLSRPEVRALLAEHLAAMHEHSPPGNVFALDVDGLRSPGVTLWTAWDDDVLLGCGALKQLDDGHGEIKSMRTAAHAIRRGVAAAVLDHLLAEALRRGWTKLSLETGTGDYFEPAHALYRRAGFVECGPFGDYVETEFSRYFTLDLAPDGPAAAPDG